MQPDQELSQYFRALRCSVKPPAIHALCVRVTSIISPEALQKYAAEFLVETDRMKAMESHISKG